VVQTLLYLEFLSISSLSFLGSDFDSKIILISYDIIYRISTYETVE